MDIQALLNLMLTLFLLLSAGYICRKIGIIDDTSSKALSRIIIKIGQPMMLISALARAEYSPENLTVAWQVTVLGFVSVIAGCALAFVLCKSLKGSFEQNKLFEFALVFGNTGFVGFPVLDSILGDGIGSFMGVFYNIGFQFIVWTWGIVILGRGRDDIRLTFKKAIINYGTVPCFIGLVFFLLKPYFVLPDFCLNFIGYLGGLCTPVSVLVTGSLIATMSLKEMFTSRKLYLHSAMRLLLFPFLAIVAAKLCGLEPRYILLLTAMAGVPSASSVTMLSELYGLDSGFASETVGMTSLFTTLTLPLMIAFAQFIVLI